MKTGDMHRLDHPEQVYTCYSTNNFVFESGTLRFDYQSMVSPRAIYDYNMETRSARGDDRPRLGLLSGDRKPSIRAAGGVATAARMTHDIWYCYVLTWNECINQWLFLERTFNGDGMGYDFRFCLRPLVFKRPKNTPSIIPSSWRPHQRASCETSSLASSFSDDSRSSKTWKFRRRVEMYTVTHWQFHRGRGAQSVAWDKSITCHTFKHLQTKRFKFSLDVGRDEFERTSSPVTYCSSSMSHADSHLISCVTRPYTASCVLHPFVPWRAFSGFPCFCW